MAIRKDFQGYFLDPLEILINKARYKEEKTVMRPSYSYMGDYTVDRSVLAEICRHETEKVKDVKAGEIHIKSLKNGVQLYINIIVKDHRNLRSIAAGVQKRTEMALENYVGITVDKIHICVKDILQK
ncbi:MAG: hypothetical protein Q8873_09600, partial [Bacillota bacterium]|nr:hypothetical protein [Bacillota bacterium]